MRRDKQRDEFYLERSGRLQDREEGEDRGRSKNLVGRDMGLFQFIAVIQHLRHSGDAAMCKTSYQASRMSSKHPAGLVPHSNINTHKQ